MLEKLKRLNGMAAQKRESKALQDGIKAINTQVENMAPIHKLADITNGFGNAPQKDATSQVTFTPPSLDALKKKAASATADDKEL